MCACVRAGACARVCMRPFVRSCVRACVLACVRDVFAIYVNIMTQADNDNN